MFIFTLILVFLTFIGLFSFICKIIYLIVYFQNVFPNVFVYFFCLSLLVIQHLITHSNLFVNCVAGVFCYVGTAVCCISRALPPSDFDFLTSECHNLQFKGFGEIRGKEGMWHEINPQDSPVQSFFFADFCGECNVTCVGV